MSYDAEEWARSQTVGNSTSKNVLRELAYCMNSKTGLCCPSLSSLCKVLEIKKPHTVLAAIVRLEELGLVSRKIERSESGEILRTLYSFPTYSPNKGKKVCRKTADRYAENEHTRMPEIGRPYAEDEHTVCQKTADRYAENRQVTRNTEQGKEQGIEQGINTPAPSDDLVLSPDTEQPKTKAKRTKTTACRPDDVSEQVWEEFLILRQQKKKTFTDLALQGMRREAKAAGLTLEEAMTMSIERGWQSFQAKYVRESGPYSSTRPPQRSFNRPLSREQMALEDDF